MWIITYIENDIRTQTSLYSMSEADARESFCKYHPKGKILNIFYDATISE